MPRGSGIITFLVPESSSKDFCFFVFFNGGRWNWLYSVQLHVLLSHVDQLEVPVLVRFRVPNEIVLYQFNLVSGSEHPKLLTITRTHLTQRHGIRAKSNQPFVAQSEVALAHPHTTLTSNLTITSQNFAIAIAGLRPWGFKTL